MQVLFFYMSQKRKDLLDVRWKFFGTDYRLYKGDTGAIQSLNEWHK